MTWKATALVSSATVFATWLGWTSAPPAAAVDPRPQTAVAGQGRAAPAAIPGTAAPIDIEAEAERLGLRVRSQIDYQPPARNPFRFTAARAARPTPAQAGDGTGTRDAAGSVADGPSLPPALSLAGIATDEIDGATVRTAIISTPAGVTLVKEHGTVAGYRVEQVGEHAVDLVGDDGVRLTLALRP